MESTMKNYGSLIEKIRKDRKLSREELCDGIMSKRNYQRFASGEISISSDKLLLITDKLMLDTYSLQEIYKTDNQDEYQKLKKAFNAVSNWDEDEANFILATIDYDNIISSVNKQLYDFTNLLIKKKKNKFTDSEFYKRTEILIDYPSILRKKMLNAVEISGLFNLMSVQTKNKNNEIIEFFIKMLHRKNSNSYWLTNEIKTGIYANITKGLYHLQEYEICNNLCDEGIDISIRSSRFYGISNMLGHKLLSLNKLGRIDEAYDAAIRLYMHLLVENDQKKILFYKNLINTNLKIDIDKFTSIKKEA